MISKNSTPDQVKQKLVEYITKHHEGDYNGAIKGYKAILKAEPHNRAAKMFYGVALNQSGQSVAALKCLNEVLQSAPDSVDVLYHLGVVFQSLGRLDDAYSNFTKALRINPQNVSVLSARAKVFSSLGRHQEGLNDAETAISLNSGYAEAYLHKGICLFGMAEYEKAVESYKVALSIQPNSPEAYNNIGTIYMAHEKYEDAIVCFDQAVQLRPDYGSAHNNLGVCHYQLNHYDQALSHFDLSLKYKPGDASTLGNQAGVLRHVGRFDEAKPLFEKALKLNPALSHVHSNYLMCLHYMDDVPRKLMFKAHKDFDRKYGRPLAPKSPIKFPNVKDEGRPLRVGMVSANFSRHPVGYMILPALDHMDKDQVHFYGYSDLKVGKNDDFTARIQENCQSWVKTLGMNDDELYDQIRRDEIDILLDLTGHAEGGGRLLVFARRAAPVQVEWIGGLFDTSGMKEMDWIIGDQIEIPEGDDEWYTERVYRMPDDYICYEPPHYAPDVTSLPALENGYVTFGNLNNPSKTNDYSLRLWADVLAAVPGSKLLSSGKAYKHEVMRNRFYKIFEEKGLDKDRLIFEQGAGHIDFIGTYNRIDIALDPYPYSGGLTTCEALWMGVPVVALPGPTFAGKHAATHLYHSGFGEWIAQDAQDYVDRAKKWSADLDALSTLREGLREKVAASPLVNGALFADNLHKAFRSMWQDWLSTSE